MATKLSALLGVLKTVKEDGQKAIDRTYHSMQKRVLFDGLVRTYQKRDDDGDDLPPEGTLVQQHAEKMLSDLAKTWTRLLDVTATVDVTNTRAAAPVVVDGNTLTEPLPATHLVYLEKQLVHLRTVLASTPVLDPSKQWTWEPGTEVFVSQPVTTFKTKKVPRNHVRFPGSDKHPPQVDVYNEDVTVGEWTKVDFSAALESSRKRDMIERVEQLIAAVRVAREEANSAEVTDVRYAEGLFDFVLGD